eukprot:snap_masked-scaffold_4-processed-gene-0.23-mRNA-1 protein AED:1.00 eAED:1.00 QI:0/-1/0/0/-1/1/1/0/82
MENKNKRILWALYDDFNPLIGREDQDITKKYRFYECSYLNKILVTNLMQKYEVTITNTKAVTWKRDKKKHSMNTPRSSAEVI